MNETWNKILFYMSMTLLIQMLFMKNDNRGVLHSDYNLRINKTEKYCVN